MPKLVPLFPNVSPSISELVPGTRWPEGHTHTHAALYIRIWLYEEKGVYSYALITTPSLRHWLGGIITVIHDVSTGRRPPCAVDLEKEHPEHFPQLSGSGLFYSDSQKILLLSSHFTLQGNFSNNWKGGSDVQLHYWKKSLFSILDHFSSLKFSTISAK